MKVTRDLNKLLAPISSIIAAGLGFLADLGIAEAKTVFGVGGAFLIVLIVFTVVISNFNRGPRKVSNLKIQLMSAYVEALDKCNLNPSARK